MTPTPGRRDPLALLLYAGAAALLVGAPFFFYPLFLTKVLCYALFACAFNLLLGSCGLLSFGHAAYFGAAAYVAGHAAKVWGLPFEVCLALVVMASALLGAVFGYISIRRQGIYFAMITLALAQMVYFWPCNCPSPARRMGSPPFPGARRWVSSNSTIPWCSISPRSASSWAR